MENVMTGIKAANSLRMLRLMSRAAPLAPTNFSYSWCCEFISRMSAAPRMLSLMTLFSRSIACWAWTNSFRTLPRTTLNVTPMIGMTVSTARASFQLIESSRMLAPMIRKTEEMSDATASDTNIFTASTSEVRLVSRVAGVICWMNA